METVRYEKERVFVRGISAKTYTVSEYLKWVQEHPRVFKSKDMRWKGGPRYWSRSMINPMTSPSQSVYFEMLEMAPHARSMKHGHQNEAMIYILEGHGHDVHDGKRYDWEKGDVVVVHNESVHQHFNPSESKARLLVIKAKPLFLFLNLCQQGALEPALQEGNPNYQPGL